VKVTKPKCEIRPRDVIATRRPYLENDAIIQAGVTAFAQALERFGWVEGKNIRIDYRFAAGDPRLFKTYASELVGLRPDAILASTTPALASLREQRLGRARSDADPAIFPKNKKLSDRMVEQSVES